jgi:hypothetical protein
MSTINQYQTRTCPPWPCLRPEAQKLRTFCSDSYRVETRKCIDNTAPNDIDAYKKCIDDAARATEKCLDEACNM